jgi:hypothetical protein
VPAVPVVNISFEGVRGLARSPELAAHLKTLAERVAQRARSDADPAEAPFIEASSFIGVNRANASVMWRGGAPTEIRDRTLGRAIDAAHES